MNCITIILAILLFGLAIWLFKLSKPQVARIYLDAVIDPNQYIRSGTIYEFNEKHFLIKLSCCLLFLLIEAYLLLNGYITFAIVICFIAAVILSAAMVSTGASCDTEDSDELGYSGSLNLPSKIFAGDSHNIDINLSPIIGKSSRNRGPQKGFDGKSAQSIDIIIPMSNSEEEFIEIEIQAAGLTIGGDKKQRNSNILDSLTYHWNCYFPNSGVHEINFVLRMIKPNNNTVELGTLKRTVKVAKFLGLTKRQVEAIGWICGGVAGFTGFVALILKLVHIFRV